MWPNSVTRKVGVESDGLDLNPNSATSKLCTLDELSGCSEP